MSGPNTRCASELCSVAPDDHPRTPSCPPVQPASSCTQTATAEGASVVTENKNDERAFWRRDCDRTDPHEPHPVEHREHRIEPTCENERHATCRGEHRVWCYGVVAPDSLRGKLEALRPGQRVRVVLEGVVDEERHYGLGVEWPACSIRANDGMVVLRYTGKHPGTADYGDAGSIRGQLVGPVVDVEVIPDA